MIFSVHNTQNPIHGSFLTLGHGVLKTSSYYFIQNELIKEAGGWTWAAESLLFSILCLLHILNIFMMLQMLCPSHCYFSVFWKWKERIFKHPRASKNGRSRSWIQGIKPNAIYPTKLGGQALCGGHSWIVGHKELLKVFLPTLSVNKASGLCWLWREKAKVSLL